MFRLSQFTPPLIPLKPTPPVPSGEIPMDIDAVWKVHSLPPRGCYWCGEANHLVKDCPYCLDIQKLTMKQWEKLIEDLMTLKDTVEEKEVGSAPEKDFV